jgi:hypothetical protein
MRRTGLLQGSDGRVDDSDRPPLGCGRWPGAATPIRRTARFVGTYPPSAPVVGASTAGAMEPATASVLVPAGAVDSVRQLGVDLILAADE